MRKICVSTSLFLNMVLIISHIFDKNPYMIVTLCHFCALFVFLVKIFMLLFMSYKKGAYFLLKCVYVFIYYTMMRCLFLCVFLKTSLKMRPKNKNVTKTRKK